MRIICNFMRVAPSDKSGKSKEGVPDENSRVYQSFLDRNARTLRRQAELKERIEEQARNEVTKIDAIKKRSQKKEKAAVQKRLESKFDRGVEKIKDAERQASAKQKRNKVSDQFFKESMLNYEQHQKEIARKLAERREHERAISQINYTRFNETQYESCLESQSMEQTALDAEAS